MGPKKKGKGKKGDSKKKGDKEKVEPTEWDDLTLEELQNAVSSLETNLATSQRDRGRAQAEHDAVQSYRAITQNQIKEIELQIDALDRRIEQVQEDNAVELRVYAHKVKHINYDHDRKLLEVESLREENLAKERSLHSDCRKKLEREREGAGLELREGEAAAAAMIEQAKALHEGELKQVTQNLQANLKEFKAQCDARMAEMRSDLDLNYRVEVRAAEEQAHLHISEVERRHRDAYEDARGYFNSIIKGGLDEIEKLRKDINRMKETEQRTLSKMEELKEESGRLGAPLRETAGQVSKMKHEIRDKDKDRASLQNTKARLGLAQERLLKMTSEFDVLKDKFGALERERDMYCEKLESNHKNMEGLA